MGSTSLDWINMINKTFGPYDLEYKSQESCKSCQNAFFVLLEIAGEARVARRSLETVATRPKRGDKLDCLPLWDVLTC